MLACGKHSCDMYIAVHILSVCVRQLKHGMTVETVFSCVWFNDHVLVKWPRQVCKCWLGMKICMLEMYLMRAYFKIERVFVYSRIFDTNFFQVKCCFIFNSLSLLFKCVVQQQQCSVAYVSYALVCKCSSHKPCISILLYFVSYIANA